VLFIDASKEFESGKKQNIIREQHISRVVDTYKEFLKGGGEIEKYAHRAKFEEIEKNEFNLNIPRYVDTFEKEEEIDIVAVQKRIEELDEEIIQNRMSDGSLTPPTALNSLFSSLNSSPSSRSSSVSSFRPPSFRFPLSYFNNSPEKKDGTIIKEKEELVVKLKEANNKI
jgi:hypothetical protein